MDQPNPYTLRRGFYTQYKDSDVSYFFTDNFFAHYFAKMSYDSFVPDPATNEFLLALQDRSFSARFTRRIDRIEVAKAGYDVQGKLIKEPGFECKLGHVIDACGPYDNGKAVVRFKYRGTKSSAAKKLGICDMYFPRGHYEDWDKGPCKHAVCNAAINNVPGYEFIRTVDGAISPDALSYLKAHFLRLACPANYFLAPKANNNGNTYQYYGQHTSVKTKKDIAELPELQEYIIGKYCKKYGPIYEKYLENIMWKSNVSAELSRIKSNMSNLGKKTIDLHYSPTPYNSTTLPASSTPTKVATSSSTISRSYTPTEIAQTLKAYLFDGKSYIKIEETILKISNKRGWQAMGIVRSYGIESKAKKGIYKGLTIDDAIAQGLPEDEKALKFIKDNMPV